MTRITAYILLLLVSLCASATAQWKPVGPPGTSVSALLAQDTMLYAGSVYDVFRSSLNADQWTVTDSLHDNGVLTLGNLGSKIIAGSMERLSATTDQGLHWNVVLGNDVPGAGRFVSFANAGGVLFVVREGVGIFRSLDSGATWTLLPLADSLSKNSIRLLSYPAGNPLSPSYNLLASTYDGHLYHSTDLGFAWTLVGSGLSTANPVVSFAVRSEIFLGTRPRFFTTLYAGTFSGGAYASVDRGTTWTPLGTFPSGDAEVNAIAFAGTNSDTLLAGCNSGLFRLVPTDTVWRPITDGIPSVSVGTIVRSNSSLYAGASTFGVFRSDDEGRSWRSASRGMPGQDVGAVAVTDGGVFAASKNLLEHSSDGGSTWTMWNGTGTHWLRKLDAGLGQTILAAALTDGFYRSTDGGLHWGFVSAGLASWASPFSVCHTSYGGKYYAGTAGGVYVSSNQGSSWSRTTGLPQDSIITTITSKTVTIGSTHLTTIYAGTTKGTLYYSENGGTNWAKTTLSTSWSVEAIATQGNYVLTGGASGLYRSSDLGATWQEAMTGIPVASAGHITSLAVYNDRTFAGTTGGIFASSNAGGSWTDVSDGLAPRHVQDLTLFRDTLYAATIAGVWRRPVAEVITSAAVPPTGTPSNFVLEQNWPNPFNPVTQINYTVGQEKDFGTIPKGPLFGVGLGEGGRNVFVQLIVYDILGREVRTLVNAHQAPGHYQVRFDGAGLSSGVYFYRLTAGSFTEARRMMLVK